MIKNKKTNAAQNSAKSIGSVVKENLKQILGVWLEVSVSSLAYAGVTAILLLFYYLLKLLFAEVLVDTWVGALFLEQAMLDILKKGKSGIGFVVLGCYIKSLYTALKRFVEK